MRLAMESASSFHGWPMWLFVCSKCVPGLSLLITAAWAMSGRAMLGCASGDALAAATSKAYFESVVHVILAWCGYWR
eukprot:5574602-Alexandrium_andersonii.AAC.1